MSRRRRIVSVAVEPRRLLVKGWKVGDLLRDAAIRGIYAGTVQAWIVDPHNLSDLVAFAEYRNVDVRVTESGDAT